MCDQVEIVVVAFVCLGYWSAISISYEPFSELLEHGSNGLQIHNKMAVPINPWKNTFALVFVDFILTYRCFSVRVSLNGVPISEKNLVRNK